MKKRPAQTCPECGADSRIGEEVHYQSCKPKKISCFAPDFGQEERTAAMNHYAMDEYFTANKHCDLFQKEFSKHVGRKHSIVVNSGSSAVWCCVAAMGWRAGDKIVTPAVNFGTSVSPLLIRGLVPVFVDCEEGTYNIDLEKALDAEPGTQGALLPHTLGNPVAPTLWLHWEKTVEDACDALDSRVCDVNCGTFGTASAFSFFPAHHITTIQGGMACTSRDDVAKLIYQNANWGRDCWCRAGQDSLCGKRFEYELEGIGKTDHKYLFALPGMNLVPHDVVGVLGNVQLKKAKGYANIRARNFKIIDDVIRPLEDLVIAPKSLPEAEPNWFAYPMTLKKGDRNEIAKRIEVRGVQTRLIFGGNITRHPMVKGRPHLIHGILTESDRVARHAFMVGLNQTITEDQMEYVAQVVKEEVTK